MLKQAIHITAGREPPALTLHPLFFMGPLFCTRNLLVKHHPWCPPLVSHVKMVQQVENCHHWMNITISLEQPILESMEGLTPPPPHPPFSIGCLASQTACGDALQKAPSPSPHCKLDTQCWTPWPHPPPPPGGCNSPEAPLAQPKRGRTR